MVRFIIKVYMPNKRFPKGGQLTQFIAKKKVGDTLEISGPVGRCRYLGNTMFMQTSSKTTFKARKITFIAGGVGITPFYQLLIHMNDNNEKFDNDMKIKLLFANKSSKDIILRKELNLLKEKKIIDDLKFCLDKVDEPNWKGFEGYIQKPMLEEFLWDNTPDHYVIMCGPPMMCTGIINALDELKYENYYKY